MPWRSRGAYSHTKHLDSEEVALLDQGRIMLRRCRNVTTADCEWYGACNATEGIDVVTGSLS